MTTLPKTELGKPSKPIVLGNNTLVLYPLTAAEMDAAAEASGSAATTDPTGLAMQTANTYKSWWAYNDATSSVQRAVLNSSKFEDNFMTTYFGLFMSTGGAGF
jgi:hypothetical protein